MNRFIEATATISFVILIIAVFAVIFAFPVMWLWNAALVPAVTFANPIGFWQAMGINILAGFLFNKPTSKS